MRFDTGLRGGLEDAAGDAARAEAAGFDAVWSLEVGRDPYLPLALAAPATARVGLGTAIAVAFARSPMSTAQAAWDLQRLSAGRLRLGLGTQVRAHVERRYSMPFDHPAARLADYVRCLRAIWETFQTGAKPAFEGRFHRFTLMNPFFNPGPIEHPRIPVYVAGVNPRMCRVAGEVGDGLHAHPMHTVRYLNEVARPALAEGARGAGADPERLEIYAPVFVVTGDDEAERARAEADVRRQIAFYASTPSYRCVLECSGLDGLGKTLSAHARAGEWDAMAREVPDAFLDEVAVAAAPGELAAALRRRYAGVVDRISFYNPPAWDDARLRAFLSEIHEAPAGT